MKARSTGRQGQDRGGGGGRGRVWKLGRIKTGRVLVVKGRIEIKIQVGSRWGEWLWSRGRMIAKQASKHERLAGPRQAGVVVEDKNESWSNA